MKLIAVIFCGFILFTGCAVRSAAPTRVSMSMPDLRPCSTVEVGFEDAAWTENREQITIVGHGWMPREHQTQLRTWKSSFEPVRSRYFRLTSTAPRRGLPRTWQIELVVDRSLPCDGSVSETLGPYDTFAGQFRTPAEISTNTLNLALDRITLHNSRNQALTISGRITAVKADPEKMHDMQKNFLLAKNFH